MARPPDVFVRPLSMDEGRKLTRITGPRKTLSSSDARCLRSGLDGTCSDHVRGPDTAAHPGVCRGVVRGGLIGRLATHGARSPNGRGWHRLRLTESQEIDAAIRLGGQIAPSVAELVDRCPRSSPAPEQPGHCDRRRPRPRSCRTLGRNLPAHRPGRRTDDGRARRPRLDQLATLCGIPPTDLAAALSTAADAASADTPAE